MPEINSKIEHQDAQTAERDLHLNEVEARLAAAETHIAALTAEQTGILDRNSRAILDRVRNEHIAVRTECDTLRNMLAKQTARIEQLKAEHTSALAMLERREAQLAASAIELQSVSELVRNLHHQNANLDDNISERFSEIAKLSSLVSDLESTQPGEKDITGWMFEVMIALNHQSKWYRFLPKKKQRERELRRLNRLGLFDANAYCKLYPDVEAENIDPLYHYIKYGRYEGRKLMR